MLSYQLAKWTDFYKILTWLLESCDYYKIEEVHKADCMHTSQPIVTTSFYVSIETTNLRVKMMYPVTIS